MATVTTATSSLDVEVNYICSVCGTENTQRTKIQVSTNNANKATERMHNILTELASDDLSKRYTHANLKCTCKNCKYSEPWTGLDFYKLDDLIRVLTLVCGLIYLTQGLQPIMKHFEFPQFYPLGSCIMQSLTMLVIMLPPVIVFLIKKAQASTSAKKIAELPAHSLPRISVPRPTVPGRDDIMARVRDNMNRQ